MEYNYDGMLAALGRAWNLEGLEFADDNCCELLIDKFALNIQKNEELCHILITGVVCGDLPDPVEYSLVLDLLEFALAPAFQAGPAVGRDSETGFLVAYVILPMQQMDEQDFPMAVEQFFMFQKGMADRIASSTVSPAPDAQADENLLQV